MFEEKIKRKNCGDRYRRACDPSDHAFAETLSEEPQQQCANQGREYYVGKRMLQLSASPFKLQFEVIDFVNVERLTIAKDRNDYCETDSRFGGGYGHDDEDKQLAAHVAKKPRQRNERQVDCVQ